MKALCDLLTSRELEFARLVCEGFSNAEIAKLTGCSEKYINNRLSLLYAKLEICKSEGGSGYDPRIRLALMYDREVRPRQGVAQNGDSL
jgi:DNA-binding NarL/FixJ family response regulator